MVSGGKHIFTFLIHKAGTYRQSAAKSFGSAHNIRLNSVLLIAKETAGAADTSLYFINHQKNILILAEFRQFLYKFFCHGANAALTLHKFNQHCTSFLRNDGTHALHIRFRIEKAFGQWGKLFMKHILSGGSQCGNCASVKGILQSHNLAAVFSILILTVFAGNLNCTFICLCTAVSKKYARHPTSLTELLSCLNCNGAVIQIGKMLNLCRLSGNSCHPLGVAVPQTIDADSGGKVNILFPVCVPCSGIFALYQCRRKSSICVHQIFAVIFLNGSDLHKIFLLYISCSWETLDYTNCILYKLEN